MIETHPTSPLRKTWNPILKSNLNEPRRCQASAVSSYSPHCQTLTDHLITNV